MNPDINPFCLDSFWESFFLEKNCRWEAMTLILAWSLWSGPVWSLFVWTLLGAHCCNLSFCLEPMYFGFWGFHDVAFDLEEVLCITDFRVKPVI